MVVYADGSATNTVREGRGILLDPSTPPKWDTAKLILGIKRT